MRFHYDTQTSRQLEHSRHKLTVAYGV